MPDSHPFDAAIALTPQGTDTWAGSTSPAYANMIGPFGGTTCAQALAAVMAHPQRLGEPVSFTVNYAAAVADGEFTVHARPVRTNRSTQHWTLEMRQADQVVLTATAVTAQRRQTWAPSNLPLPAVPPPHDVALAKGRGPVEWVHRYELRFIAGAFPPVWDGSDKLDSTTQLWVRDNPPRPLDFASLAAMCDVFFPRIWLRRATFVPLGTVSMTIYFHAGSEELAAAGESYLLGQARAQAFHNGYFDQAVQVWTEAGALLATSHQVVYYKE